MVKELELRVRVVSNPDFPVLDVLIDGEELGTVPGERKWQGWDPDEILRRPTPLLPGRGPHRVAVYRCSCGDAGCSCIAVMISREQGLIHWRDARTYTGVYVSPTEPDVERYPGKPLDEVPDLVFDAEQYRAAVHWSIVERFWETEARTTARLLQERLSVELPQGWTAQWCAPHPTATGVTRVWLRGPGHPGMTYSLPTGTDTAAANAATMAALLAGTPAQRWPQEFADIPIRYQR